MTERHTAPRREFFRMGCALLRRLPTLARRHGKLRPKLDIFVLLALHAEVSRASKSSIQVTRASGDDMAAGTFTVRQSRVLEMLGFARRDGDFRGNAWKRLKGSITRLSTSPLKIPFKRQAPAGGRRGRRGRLEDARFNGTALEIVSAPGEQLRVRLNGYSTAGDNYYVLVPWEIFRLRRDLGELASRVLWWLLFKHRGARQNGRLKHKWKLTITPEVLVEAKLLPPSDAGRARELRRQRQAFEDLESAGVLRIVGNDWPVVVHLSRKFFHTEEDAR